MSKTIEKKILSEYFDKVVNGEKTYELRLADWDCQPGDTLVLNEIDSNTKQPTGRSIRRNVGYVGKTKDFDFWSKEGVDKCGYQIISLRDDKDKSKEKFKLIPAVYLILRKKDEVLLLQRANTGYQDGKYSLIAGHVDGDELATNEITREAKEEAGITINPKKLKFVHVAHRLNRNQLGQERIDLFYELWEWQGEVVNAEPNKCDNLSWYPINNLPNNMLPFIKLVLNNVSKSIYYSEYTEEPV